MASMLPRLASRVFQEADFRVAGPGADDVSEGRRTRMLDQGFEPLRILAGLRSHGVSFVLVGGLGAAVRGGPVETDDVDIVPPGRPAEPSASGALAPAARGTAGCPERSATDDRVSYDTSYGRLDCMELPSEFASLERERDGDGRRQRRHGSRGVARGPRPLEADVPGPRRCGATPCARRRGVTDVGLRAGALVAHVHGTKDVTAQLREELAPQWTREELSARRRRSGAERPHRSYPGEARERRRVPHRGQPRRTPAPPQEGLSAEASILRS